ncbi:ATP-binding protein [Candidatus Peregrinibacteria bacterium]|jgi:putative ATP-dependent endonuclease of the OLD family|nr:ATP-binding protein [Candidatus Peregrinibacteria bacterium]
MDPIHQSSITVKNYKCFEEEQGFTELMPINVIIGRNNSGKSALLDLFDYARSINDRFETKGHKGVQPEYFQTFPIQEAAVDKAFKENVRIGGQPINNRQYGERFVGKRGKYRFQNGGPQVIPLSMEDPYEKAYEKNVKDMMGNQGSPFQGKVYHRLYAERNVIPEKQDDDGKPKISPDGTGATNMIQTFLNRKGLDRKVIEIELLAALNSIVQPEMKFSRILIERAGTFWEIELEEVGKGSVLLSDSGSGLKTILLVLLYIIVLPKLEKKALQDFVFGFEELENNLHPGLERKLLAYIKKIANKCGTTFILTTHSSVAIDFFSRDENAQIIHVTHDGEKATCSPVISHMHKKGILDDLDIRASDLLQSNGIIWVEGPSDRTYVNRWIELYSDGELQEGVHYQCLFYGGKLLAHLSASDDVNAEEIQIFKINTNAVVLIDRDRDNGDDPINDTKQRIADEAESIDAMVWVTDGREIENYLAKETLDQHFERTDLPDIGQFQKFPEYLNANLADGEGDKFSSKKTVFAAKISPLLTKASIITRLDLNERMLELCAKIRQWNNLENNGN